MAKMKRESGVKKTAGITLSRGMRKRAEERRKRIVGHIAKDWQDAEDWDLEFWIGQTPQMRIRAMEELRREWRVIEHARENAGH
jgi:hypothetical protein